MSTWARFMLSSIMSQSCTFHSVTQSTFGTRSSDCLIDIMTACRAKRGASSFQGCQTVTDKMHVVNLVWDCQGHSYFGIGLHWQLLKHVCLSMTTKLHAMRAMNVKRQHFPRHWQDTGKARHKQRQLARHAHAQLISDMYERLLG